MKVEIKKLALSGMLIALAFACSPISIPIGASRCFPVQHMVNVIAAFLLGPWYGLAIAAITSLLRVLAGTGTLLAFPGSMCGAFICGMIYAKSKNPWLTYAGEIFGTGVVGGLLAWPVAVWIMGKEAALWAYIVPFLVSTIGGTCLAFIVMTALQKTKALAKIEKGLGV